VLAAQTHKERIIYQHIAPASAGLFLSDADGRDERPLIPAISLNYNPSFSSDAKWIVFTSERTGHANIYRVHPDGSGLERLTASRAFDDQGALSPDGKTLAFVSTRDGGTANVWLLDLVRHRYRNLTKSNAGNFRPSWSPDGKWIAFTSDRDTPHRRVGPDAAPPGGSGCCGWELLHFTTIYIVHPDGSGLRRLTALDQSARSPKWSTDGKRLIYDEGFEASGTLQLASVSIETGDIHRVTTGSEDKSSPQYLNVTEIGYLQSVDGGKSELAYTSGLRGPPEVIWNPSWSEDGKAVVYAKPSGVFQPGGFVPPTLDPLASSDPAFDFYRTDSCVAYSPDGRQLAMTSCVRGQKTLMVMNADGSGLRKIFDATSRDASVVSPSWSPDGKFIAFAMARPGLGTRNPITPVQLALIRSDGSGLRILTEGNNSSAFPSLSPDGNSLVYRVLGRERGLRIMSLKDGKVTRLTTGWDNFPDWSPRGDHILFTSFRTGDFEIWTIRPDGSDLRQLTHDHGNDAHAIWSPDGRWILFTSSRMGWRDEGGGRAQTYGKLFIMRANGSSSRQLTDNRWEEGPIAWVPAIGKH
jgi:Tol biopolymer transport system component